MIKKMVKNIYRCLIINGNYLMVINLVRIYLQVKLFNGNYLRVKLFNGN